MSNVKIPGIGEVPKPLAIGGAVVGLAVSYVAYKHISASKAAASSAATTAAAPVATGDPYPSDGTTGNPSDPNSIDPTTGLTYGDEELEGVTDTGADDSGALQDVGDSAPIDTGTTTDTGTASSSAVTTPQQWAAAVEAQLPTLGYDASTVAAAVGRYIAGLSLTSAQATIIQAALAEVPYPGTAPPVQVTPTTPTATGGDLPAPAGMSDTPYSSFVDLGWHAVTGATEYHYQVLTTAGAVVVDGATASTNARGSGLKASTAYKWRVSVENPRGLWTGYKSFTTPKA
jgi:hypothetical protein